jgi:uncharacterized protein with von Willebrand factor type A (vWA) domain
VETQYRHQTFIPFSHQKPQQHSQIRHSIDPELTKYQVAHISTEDTKTDDPRELSATKNQYCSTMHHEEQPINNINEYRVKPMLESFRNK